MTKTPVTNTGLAAAMNAVGNEVIHHAQNHQSDSEPVTGVEVAVLLAKAFNTMARELMLGDQTFPDGLCPIPNNPDLAAGMLLVGERWLRDHAPERLQGTDLDCPACGGSGHRDDNPDLARAPLGALTTIGDVLHRKVENGWLVATSHSDLVISNGEPAIHDGEDFSPLATIISTVSVDPVRTHGGLMRQIAWRVEFNGVIIGGEVTRHNWDTPVKDIKPPYDVVNLKEKLDRALASLPTRGKQDTTRYRVGDLTMKHLFHPGGLTNMSDLQAVLDAAEAGFARLEAANK